MKRLKKMTDIQDVTDRLLMEQTAPAFRTVMLKALPERFFGPVIAAHITAVSVRDRRLILHVPDPAWRQEINNHSVALLADARRLEPALAGVLVTS